MVHVHHLAWSREISYALIVRWGIGSGGRYRGSNIVHLNLLCVCFGKEFLEGWIDLHSLEWPLVDDGIQILIDEGARLRRCGTHALKRQTSHGMKQKCFYAPPSKSQFVSRPDLKDM